MNITNLTKCPEATEEIWEANAVRMDMETREEVEIKDISKLTGGEHDAWKETIDNSLIPETLVLREGAQVMCLSNIDIEKGIVNGARGVVRSYDLKTGYPVVLWKTSKKETVVEPVLLPTRHPLIFVKQIPLCQAWAITIHKSQGQTLDCVEVDIGTSVFVSG
jgi:ATP-dependent DNA helicase PIF1